MIIGVTNQKGGGGSHDRRHHGACRRPVRCGGAGNAGAGGGTVLL